MTDAKCCSACGIAKPLTHYHRNRRARDGLCRRCKPCAIDASRRNYRDRRAAAGRVADERWTAERFLDYVAVSEDCWTWHGPDERAGHFNYGRFGADGCVMSAHRWSYALHNGNLPRGAFICHTCDNPRCVNPGHLYAGDLLTNSRDAVDRGRLKDQAGEANPAARLTVDAVRSIRARWQAGETQLSIALDVGMSPQQINRIVHRKSWTKT